MHACLLDIYSILYTAYVIVASGCACASFVSCHGRFKHGLKRAHLDPRRPLRVVPVTATGVTLVRFIVIIAACAVIANIVILVPLLRLMTGLSLQRELLQLGAVIDQLHDRRCDDLRL